MSNTERLEGLYVITDDTLTPKEKLLAMVEASLKGGTSIVQLRDKSSSDEEIKATSIALQKLCHYYDALFVLNDKIDIAIECKLDGLHIGKSDHHRFEEIRKNFDGIIGVSCYGDIPLAKTMQEMGADYVAFGSFFVSPTKPHANIVPFSTLSEARETLDVPVCAIGGIKLSNVDQIMEHKPDMVSLVNDIWSADNIQEQSQHYANLLT
jgi:thiamine-phosphate pyrophosphorylase